MRYAMLLLALVGCTKAGDDTDGNVEDDTEDTCVATDEVCDEIDNDCDGEVDEGVQTTFYQDRDADGYGLTEVLACTQPDGTATAGNDCREDDPDVNPGATETCNDEDDDCDTETDEGAADAVQLYPDADGDGYGDYDGVIVACEREGYIPEGGDCDDTDPHVRTTCFPEFSGEVVGPWETFDATPIDWTLWSVQVYSPKDWNELYFATSDPMATYDVGTNTWAATRTTAPYAGAWAQTAPWDGDLWMVRNSSVYHYDIETDTWDTPVTDTHYGDYENLTESDNDGHIYGFGFDREGLPYVVDYDSVGGGVVGHPVSLLDSYDETRLAWDPGTNALYFAGFASTSLYKMALDTYEVTQLTSIPEDQMNDIFCGDRSGHLYAAGGSDGTSFWQYDIAADKWHQIEDLAGEHGNNGACSVHGDGHLYVLVPETASMYRIQLSYTK